MSLLREKLTTKNIARHFIALLDVHFWVTFCNDSKQLFWSRTSPFGESVLNARGGVSGLQLAEVKAMGRRLQAGGEWSMGVPSSEGRLRGAAPLQRQAGKRGPCRTRYSEL